MRTEDLLRSLRVLAGSEKIVKAHGGTVTKPYFCATLPIEQTTIQCIQLQSWYHSIS